MEAVAVGAPVGAAVADGRLEDFGCGPRVAAAEFPRLVAGFGGHEFHRAGAKASAVAEEGAARKRPGGPGRMAGVPTRGRAGVGVGEQEAVAEEVLLKRRFGGTKRPDAGDERMRAGSEVDGDGVVEPAFGAATGGASRDPCAVEPEVKAFVGGDEPCGRFADVLRPLQLVGGDDGSLNVGQSDPRSGPDEAFVEKVLVRRFAEVRMGK